MENLHHYLSMVYLAETAIVFNITYIELKWKKRFVELTEKMNELVSLSTFSIDRNAADSICNQRGCIKCEDITHLANKFSKFEINYISKMAKAMHSVPQVKFGNIKSSLSQYELLFRTWMYAECKFYKKFLCFIFHIMARTYLDLFISLTALIASTLIVIIMTMGDNRLDCFSILTNVGLWKYPDVWTSSFFCFLLICMILPAVFWYSWRKFLVEYECLSYLLIEAYQKKSKGSFNIDADDLSN